MSFARLRSRLQGQVAEFCIIAAYNAATLGAALFLFGHLVGLRSQLDVVIAAHATSAVLSYAFCTRVFWAAPADEVGRRLAKAGGFFALALVSAATSMALTAAVHAQARSLLFVGLNYAAVGAISVTKFVLQRRLMTAPSQLTLPVEPLTAAVPTSSG